MPTGMSVIGRQGSGVNQGWDWTPNISVLWKHDAQPIGDGLMYFYILHTHPHWK